MLIESKPDLRGKLKEVFGYSEFRGNQERIIKSVLEGKDAFVIMPTGAGKSMCYQLPAILMDGLAIVISPLIALMKNQVDQMNAVGVNARVLNSTLSRSEATKVKREIMDGETKLLYVAPESLTKEENVQFFQSVKLSFIAIDEAHCISEWGHDFRPEYRKIRSIIEKLGDNLPLIALTATATPKVQIDIQRNLGMENATIFKSSFNRENLYYEVRPKVSSKRQLVQFVKEQQGASGIIYCLSRKKVEEIAEFLKVNDINALPYHAGMDADVRVKHQDAFLNEDTDVIVATIAFGMGIDKPDVRFVVHYDVPKSLEGYYQETGRAGRDSMNAKCLMFYSYNDILKIEKFSKDKTVTERDNARHLLQEMISYTESAVCRKRQLLHYFGEHLDKDCGFCDNCKNPREKYNAQAALMLALQAVAQTEERFGFDHLVDVLTGTENQYILSYGHDKLDIYGKGEDKTKESWSSVLRQALLFEFLEKDIEDYGVLKMTKKGKGFLEAPEQVTFSKDHDFANIKPDEEGEVETGGNGGCDQNLFKLIKDLRKQVAKQKGLPPYVIFQDPSMREMATTYPMTEEELSHINGVGVGKVKKFGKPFVELIRKYVEENDITTADDVFIKSAVNKSKVKIFIIQQIDRRMDLEEIAEAKNMKLADVIEEIEHICYSGTRLNLDYYIDQVLDGEKQDDLYDYFMNAETDNISEALSELGDEYTEEELRLMRIKFLSEVAN